MTHKTLRVEKVVEKIAVAAQTETAETVAGRPVEGTKTSNNINKVQKMNKKLNNTKRANSATKGKCNHAPITFNNRNSDEACAPMPEFAHPVVLFDRFLVDTSIVESADVQLKKMYPYLLPVNDYSWQELLGESFWADRPDLPIQLASVCIQHLAEQPNSRLTIAPNSANGAMRFRFD